MPTLATDTWTVPATACARCWPTYVTDVGLTYVVVCGTPSTRATVTPERKPVPVQVTTALADDGVSLPSTVVAASRRFCLSSIAASRPSVSRSVDSESVAPDFLEPMRDVRVVPRFAHETRSTAPHGQTEGRASTQGLKVP